MEGTTPTCPLHARGRYRRDGGHGIQNSEEIGAFSRSLVSEAEAGEGGETEGPELSGEIEHARIVGGG